MAVDDESRTTAEPSPVETPSAASPSPVAPSSPAAAGEPLLTVVKGEPTPEEFAALVAVVSAKLRARTAAGGSGTRAHGSSPWAAYWRRARQPLRPGPNAWRSSALPR